MFTAGAGATFFKAKAMGVVIEIHKTPGGPLELGGLMTGLGNFPIAGINRLLVQYGYYTYCTCIIPVH
jgi:hypothetical protein